MALGAYYAKQRGESLEEMSWWRAVIGKIHTTTHPKGYEKLAKEYASLFKQKEYRDHPSRAAWDVARQ